MTPHERSREFYIRRHLFVDDLLTWGQLIWEGREGEGVFHPARPLSILNAD